MDDIKEFVQRWNYRFPVDYWWRKTHNVAFNSLKHRNSNFWDQMFEYKEFRMHEQFKKPKQEYEPNTNDWLNIRKNEITRVEDGIDDALAELEKYKSSFKD